MRNALAITIGIVTSLAMTMASAKEWDLVCPNEIAAAAIRDVGVQPGWLIYNPNKLKVRSAAFSGGSPDKRMDLVPFEVIEKRNSVQERWRFDGGEVWLRCAYGEAGQITLSKKIERKPAECTVSYERNSLSKIVCLSGAGNNGF